MSSHLPKKSLNCSQQPFRKVAALDWTPEYEALPLRSKRLVLDEIFPVAFKEIAIIITCFLE